jgi:ATP-binding cassette, subfamily B, bacterial MsbA
LTESSVIKNWYQNLKSGLTRSLPQDRIAGEKGYANSLDSLQFLRPFWLRHWRKGIFAGILILLVSLLAFPVPLIYRYLIDNVILAKRLDLFPVALLVYIGIQALSMGLSTIEQFYFTRFNQEVSLDIQQTLVDHTLQLPKAFFDEKEVGYILSRLSSDVNGVRWFFSESIAYIATSILKFIGGVILLFYLEWRLGIVTVIVLPVLVFGIQFFSKRMRVLSHQSMEQHANILQRMQETISSIPLIKTFTSEKRESQRVMQAVQEGQKIELEQTVVGVVANLALGVVPDLSKAVVFISGAYLIIRGQWTLGSLMAFQSYTGYVFGPAMYLAQANMQFQNALAALERVVAMLTVVPEENLDSGYVIEHLQGDVQFEKVSFSYDGSESVLENISFDVHPGEHVAIVGPSGVGKTTLVSLILRFYQPTQGEIFFDGQSAARYELKSLRERIGFVSQSTQLLAGTLRENLCYGNLDANQAEIEQAARIAGIHDTIIRLPQGYDTIVDERGANFSDGQKQRLSIARALIKSPDILILDEPTSALDINTEKSIFDSLPEQVRGKTLFVVAHRLSTIRQADQIMVLNDKRLVATGTHAELMEKNEYYRLLYQ